MAYRLGVDVGGTFTDLLLFDRVSGGFWRHKTPSTPQDSSVGILTGVEAICGAAGITPADVEFFLHGTTVATNAILEGKGARVGLVTTQGYRQIMQIARSFVPGGLAGWIVWPKPRPLAALEDTVEIAGRMDARGNEVRPIDDADIRAALEKLKAQGIEALTVSLVNDGFYDLIEVRIPAGSLLKPNFPAALSGRTHALGRLFDILGGLLGQKTPEFLCAAGFSSSPHLFYAGTDREGKWFQLFQIGFGGIPGRPLGDGPDGHSLWPGFTNVPNEFLERYFPLVIERYETVADSGGAGLHRGGNGIEMVYRFLEPGVIAIHDDRWFVPPWGVNGGEPGARARKVLVKVDGTEVVLGNKLEDYEVEAGDQLRFITWGGGGWGDPLARDPELLAVELGQGLVTVAGALRYGVVLVDGKVDVAATEALRAEMRASRPAELPTFNYGPDIETLRANCLAETGLPAPKQPLWQVVAA